MKKGYAKLLRDYLVYQPSGPQSESKKSTLQGLWRAGYVFEIREILSGWSTGEAGFAIYDLVVRIPGCAVDWNLLKLKSDDFQYLSPLEWLAEVAE